MLSEMADFSNYGKCIELLAPGVGIISTTPDGHAAWSSGTSMAAPIVAGAWSLVPHMKMSEFVAKYSVDGKLKDLKYQTRNTALQVAQ